MDASVVLKLNSLRIRGIILIRFISRPTHLVIHEFDDTAITVPVIKKKINIF